MKVLVWDFIAAEVGPQQGPTCWAYSGLMLCAYHNIHPDLTGRVKALADAHTALSNQHLVKHNEKKSSFSWAEIAEELNKSDDLGHKSFGEELAMIAGDSPHRFELLRASLKECKVVTIEPWDITGVKKALEMNGPFYVSTLGLKPVMRVENMDQLHEAFDAGVHWAVGNQAPHASLSAYTGGPHAVVVVGYQIGGNYVVIMDPNFGSATIIAVNWDMFKSTLSMPAGMDGGHTIGLTPDNSMLNREKGMVEKELPDPPSCDVDRWDAKKLVDPNHLKYNEHTEKLAKIISS